ncbi:hypothetical protein ACFLTC_01155, partial [Chloroflexota bacterium]
METAAAQDQTAMRKRSQAPVWLRIFVGFFLLIFLSGGFYSAYLFYATVREIVGRAELSAIPHIQLPSMSLPEAAADDSVDESLPVMPEMTPSSDPGQ